MSSNYHSLLIGGTFRVLTIFKIELDHKTTPYTPLEFNTVKTSCAYLELSVVTDHVSNVILSTNLRELYFKKKEKGGN